MTLHPIKTFVVIFAIDMAFLFALSFFAGCTPRPPRHFENGDRTVLIGPKSYGDVDEPDMRHPSIFDTN